MEPMQHDQLHRTGLAKQETVGTREANKPSDLDRDVLEPWQW